MCTGLPRDHEPGGQGPPEGLFWSCSPCPESACSTIPLLSAHSPGASGFCSSQMLNQTTSEDYSWIGRRSGSSLHVWDGFLPSLPQRPSQASLGLNAVHSLGLLPDSRHPGYCRSGWHRHPTPRGPSSHKMATPPQTGFHSRSEDKGAGEERPIDRVTFQFPGTQDVKWEGKSQASQDHSGGDGGAGKCFGDEPPFPGPGWALDSSVMAPNNSPGRP